MRKSLAILFIICIGFSCITGCQTTDKTRTKAEGTAVGIGGGALFGALLGAAIGGKEGALIGAAAGALAGGAVGYAYGTHVANEKEEYANAEDWLDACVASLNTTNKETLAYNLELDKNIRDIDATTAQLVTDYENKKIEKSVLEEEKVKVDAKLAEAEEQLAKANFELENQQQVLNETKTEVSQEEYTKALDGELAELKLHIEDLKVQSEELASLSSRMSV